MCLPSPFPCQNKLVRLKGKHSVQTTHATSRLHRNIVQLCTSITEPFHIITHTHQNFRIIGYIHHNFRKPKKSGNHLNWEGLCLPVECTTLLRNSLWSTNLFDQDRYKGKMEEKLWVRLIFILQGVLLWLRIFFKFNLIF